MAPILKLLAAFFSAGTIAFAILYAQTAGSTWLTLAITFGTFAYHFIMRLLIGLIFNTVMRNHADYTRRWYQVGRLETALYEKLRVQRWKGKMPAYHPALFDPRVHSWDEIAQAMCQAELVHEAIVVCSFLPIAAGAWFGAYPAFIITSILSAALDMAFVIMQRYNRPRIIRLMQRQRKIAAVDRRESA